MKKGEFSYGNLHTQSHMSLAKYNKQNLDSRVDSISKEILHSTKPNVKFYTNPKCQIKKQGKTFEELQKQNKVLEYELKKKINENSSLVKFFKTKNTSELSHIDIYIEMNKVTEQLSQKEEEVKEWQSKYEECANELQGLVEEKNEQELHHTEEIDKCMTTIDKMVEKHEEEIQQLNEEYENKLKKLRNEAKKDEDKRMLLEEVKKKNEKQNQQIKELKINLEKEIAQRQLENIAHEQKIQQIKDKTHHEINQKRKQHETKMGALKRQLENKDRKSRQLEEENQILMDRLDESEEKLQQQSSERNKIFNQFQLLVEKIKEKEQQDEQKSKQLSYKENCMVKKITNYEEKISSLKIKLSNLENTLNSKDQQIAKLSQNQKSFQTDKINSQSKLSSTLSQLKTVTFSNEELQNSIMKVKNQLHERQDLIQKQETQIYTLEKKNSQSLERIKGLQKKFMELQQYNKQTSKTQLQSYKTLGRLIQINNKICSFIKVGDKYEPEPQQLSQAIALLARSVEIFLQNQYSPLTLKIKQLEQKIQDYAHEFKTLIHSFSNFIPNQELSEMINEYIEMISYRESEKSDRLYLVQSINEKMIAMAAIKSYTSEKGVHGQKQKLKTEMDSFESSQFDYLRQSKKERNTSMERYDGWRRTDKRKAEVDHVEELKKYQKKRENSRRHIRNNDKENIMKNMNFYEQSITTKNLYEQSINGTNKKEQKIGLVEKKYFR